jgi:hypothetical protein
MLSIRSHLTRCPECSREERSQRAFKRLLGSVPCVEPPSGLEERLLGAIRADKPVHRWWSQLRIASLTAGVAAAATFATLALIQPKDQETAQVEKSDVTSFEINRDQAYVAGGDPLGVGPVALPVDYAKR